MSWWTNGVKTNPPAGEVLADTGPLPESGSQPIPAMLISSTVEAVVLFQHRNAANNGNVRFHAIPVPANGDVSLPAMGTVPTVPGERFRIELFAAIVGRIQASFFQ